MDMIRRGWQWGNRRRLWVVATLAVIMWQVGRMVVFSVFNYEDVHAVYRTPVPGTSAELGQRELFQRLMDKDYAQNHFDFKDEKEFLARIHQLQNPPDCATARAIVIKFSLFDNGLAAMLSWMTGAMTYAYVHGRTVVVAEPDQWMWAPDCGNRTFHCYFQPLSGCTEEQVWPSREVVLLSYATEAERVVYMDRWWSDRAPLDFSLNEFRACRNIWPPSWCRYFYMVPTRFTRRGMLWWKAQLARYIFRPREEIVAEVRAAKDRMSWDSRSAPKICLHIRRGDKIAGPIAESKEISMQQYADAALDVANLTGAHTVFVATDDPHAIDAVTAALNASSIDSILYDAAEVRNDGSGLKIRQGTLDDVQGEMRTAAKNLALLSDCAYFIGTFTSWFSKFAYLLQYANGHFYGISLDVPLWHWMP